MPLYVMLMLKCEEGEEEPAIAAKKSENQTCKAEVVATGVWLVHPIAG